MEEKEYLEHLNQLWEKSWPAHLPRKPIYPLGEIPLTDYLREWARQTPDKACLIFYGTELTFKDLDDLSNRFAAFLDANSLQKGDRVAVFLPNCPQFLIAFYGILKLGCVHVPVNPMFKEHEFQYEINDTGAKAIVALDHLFPIVQSVKDQTSLQWVMVTRFSDFLPKEPTIPIPSTLLDPGPDCPGAMDMMSTLAEQDPTYLKVDVGLDNLAALNYTGGTTGLPKGCEHTQRDMIYTAGCAVATGAREEGPVANPVSLGYFPIFWIAGEIGGVIAPIFSGTTLVQLARWDVEAALTAIDRYQVTAMSGVVDNYLEIMEYPDPGKYNLKSIKTAGCSSFIKKLTPEYRRRWKELTGSILKESSYGMTETHTVDTFTNGMQTNDRDLKSKPVFCGLPMPGTFFKIVGFDTGDLVPLGQEGEIVIKTPSLMKAYWNKPEETQKSIKEGWLYTGDIGMLDEEGYLHFLGRRKEMLKMRGMSVFPSEIETLLGRHPAVAGSAVLGKSDPEKGEIPVAFIKLNPDDAGKTSAAEITDWCKKNMATYKVPVIKIVKEFPLTATGKIKKEELRKDLEKD
ncbi:MAG: acyl-CoA synthetase [Deltaproteobacteria bacterium RBG_13_43_22]|nr:MAG: acyl-CoA synthetase [Deltaproteobacteria bacterium RBG_13_43_22]